VTRVEDGGRERVEAGHHGCSAGRQASRRPCRTRWCRGRRTGTPPRRVPPRRRTRRPCVLPVSGWRHPQYSLLGTLTVPHAD
jgi:hypothetical protein